MPHFTESTALLQRFACARSRYAVLDSIGHEFIVLRMGRRIEELVAEIVALADEDQKRLLRLLSSVVGRIEASDSPRRTLAQPVRLPIYQGKGGVAKGIDPLSNRSMMDAAGDDSARSG